MGASHSHIAERVERAEKTGILTLTGAKLKEVPEKLLKEIWRLNGLKSLDLSQNKLIAIPAKLTSLPNLKNLSLHTNRLGQLPDLSSLTALESLNLSNNALKTLPSLALPNLKTLLLSHNQLQTLPTNVFAELPNLVTFDVSHNNLKTLPPSVAELKSLEELNAENNKLETLPDELSGCKAIKTLKLKGNTLAKFPAPVLRDTSIAWVDLGGDAASEEALRGLDGYDKYMARRKNRIDQLLKT